jgi:hypothetical protein
VRASFVAFVASADDGRGFLGRIASMNRKRKRFQEDSPFLEMVAYPVPPVPGGLWCLVT